MQTDVAARPRLCFGPCTQHQEVHEQCPVAREAANAQAAYNQDPNAYDRLQMQRATARATLYEGYEGDHGSRPLLSMF